jgi:predicted ATP-grasp superfamily ATP-dependent carboligase
MPGGLLREATLMLTSLISDLSAVSATVFGLFDSRIDLGLPVEAAFVGDVRQWRHHFDRLVRAADAVWPIAPETDGLLEDLSQRVVAAGRQLLGSRPAAVRLAASKYATARALARAGVAVVPTYRCDERPAEQGVAWVAKPDDGVGCEGARVFDRAGRARNWAEAQGIADRYVLQPLLVGGALSLCALACNGVGRLLSVNRQRVEMHGDTFAYRGSEVNVLQDADGAYQRLAQRAAAAIPGLWGYFGVDLIQTQSGPVVLEVNPRLTTSYAGLREALGVNPAAMVLGLLDDSAPLDLPVLDGHTVMVDVAQ